MDSAGGFREGVWVAFGFFFTDRGVLSGVFFEGIGDNFPLPSHG
jgi:hypothetical protein